MQITEHAGQGQNPPRLPGMDPATAEARSPLDSTPDRPAARSAENRRQDPADRAAARAAPKPVRYGAGF